MLEHTSLYKLAIFVLLTWQHMLFKFHLGVFCVSRILDLMSNELVCSRCGLPCASRNQVAEHMLSWVVRNLLPHTGLYVPVFSSGQCMLDEREEFMAFPLVHHPSNYPESWNKRRQAIYDSMWCTRGGSGMKDPGLTSHPTAGKAHGLEISDKLYPDAEETCQCMIVSSASYCLMMDACIYYTL